MKGSAHSGVSTAQSLSFMWMIDFPMMFHSQFIGVKLSTVTAVFLKVCAQLCIVTVCVCVCVCVCVLSVCSSCGVIGCVTGYLSSTVHLLLPTPLLVRYCDILVLCCLHPCTSSECL